MNKKKMIVALAMAAMLTVSTGFSTIVYAEPNETETVAEQQNEEISGEEQGTQDTQEKSLQETESAEEQVQDATVAEQSNEQNTISISSNVYDIEAGAGTKGTREVSVSIVSGSAIDLSNYELYINRKTEDSNIIVNGMDSLEGILDDGKVNDWFNLSYEIPKSLTGSNLKFTLQIREKETKDVIGESQEYTIYPYEISDGVLTYRDASKGSKYLLTVETDSYIDSWDLVSGGTGNATAVYDETDRSIDYYLDPDNPSVLCLYPKSGCLIKNVEMTSGQAGTITKIEDYDTYVSYSIQLNRPAAIKVTSTSATEAKAWQSVVENYITRIRFTDWFTGDGINNHFYGDAAPVNDIASVTLGEINVYDYSYNAETYNYEIPYDEFVTIAKDFFINVPDLKNVNVNYLISYDQTSDCMVVPSGGIGNPMLITEFVEAKDIGNGRYALHFNVSKEEWDENVKPDMGNKDEYTECTLTVEDNGKGQWKYVSFEKGYTYGTATEDTPVVDDGTSTIVEKIENAEAGSTVTIDMSQSTVVSENILAAAKGKDVNIVLEMDGYTWIINGKDIQDAKEIDFGVDFDTNAIPVDIVKAIAGNKDTKQLSLAYDGQFGLKAQLKINVGKDYAKQYGNLYWYHNGSLELVDTSQVDENGFLTFTFTHASDYVIVFDNQPHQTTTQAAKTAADNPKTGDQTNAGFYTSLAAVSVLGIAVLAVLRKKKA